MKKVILAGAGGHDSGRGLMTDRSRDSGRRLMTGRSIRIMRIAGIRVGFQPLWIVIVALITWSLGSDYYPSRIQGLAPATAYALGLSSALLLFTSIVAHELGHALTARRYGVEIEGIDLWLLGGVAKLRGAARRPQDELRYALAGPAVTLGILAVLGAVAVALPASSPAAVRAVVGYQVYVNGAILVFNLLPAFPLDGGRVMRSLLWRQSGDLQKATATAARVGQAFGWFFIALGVIDTLAGAASGLWLAVIGFFVVVAAQAERRHTEVIETFAGYHASDLMTAPVFSIAEDAPLSEAADLFAQRRYSSFPVTDDHRVTGLLTIDRVREVPPNLWSATRVGEVADREAELFIEPSTDVGDLFDSPAFVRDGRAVVLGPDGDAVGIISVTDVARAPRRMRLRAPAADTAGMTTDAGIWRAP